MITWSLARRASPTTHPTSARPASRSRATTVLLPRGRRGPPTTSSSIGCSTCCAAPDVPAGERLRISVAGRRVRIRGEVESVDVLEELLGMIGDVPGVDEVVDEVEIAGI